MHCHLLDASEVYSAMELTERERKARQPFVNCSGSHEDNLTRMIQHRHAVPGWELSRGQAWLCRSPCCRCGLLLHPSISDRTQVPTALKGSWAKSFGKRCTATAAFMQGGKKSRLDLRFHEKRQQTCKLESDDLRGVSRGAGITNFTFSFRKYKQKEHMAQEKPEHKRDPPKQWCQAPVLPPAMLALTHALVLTIRPEQKSSHEPPTRVSAEVILEFALGTHTSNTFASSSL